MSTVTASRIDRLLASRGWYALAVLTVIAYLASAALLADDTPKFDDLNDVFGFFKQLALAQTPWQYAAAFFYPNNEHVTLVDHLIYFAQYHLLGDIRFYPLILLGHLIVVATGLLLGCATQTPYRAFTASTVLMGYVTLHYWDSTFKAMTAISNQAVILFAIATVFALLRWRTFFCAVLFAFLATFSQGNGLLVWPLGLLILLGDPYWRTQHRHQTMLWLLAATMSMALFFWAQQHYAITTASPVTDTPWQRLSQQPALPLLSVLAFIGSTILPPAWWMAALFVGSVCLALWLREMRQAKQHEQPLAIAIVLFLLASAAMAASLRGLAYATPTSVVESHYRMYSIALLLLLPALWLARSSHTRSHLLSAAFSLLLAFGIYTSGWTHVVAVQQQAGKFSASYDNWLMDGDFRQQAIYFPPMSDHFLFVADYLQLFNFQRLTPAGSWLTPIASNGNTPCPMPTSTAISCPVALSQRGNAIAITVTLAPQATAPESLTFCDADTPSLQRWQVPLGNPALTRWYLPAESITPGSYRVVVTGSEPCELAFTRKLRTVEQEMQGLFGQRR